MDLTHRQPDCQIPCLGQVSEGLAPTPPASLARRIKLFIRRHMNPSQERKWKTTSNQFLNRMANLRGKPTRPVVIPEKAATLAAGDLVRVKSREEIETTLNHWRQLKGCTFMPEMARYCNTTHRVLKPMRRFVDERDLRVKRSKGIVLLEGVVCGGTADFGPCDRACHLFWREEWLDKV